jgi:peptidoglycan LD-endopeptidase LytH
MNSLANILLHHQNSFHPVVEFNPATDKLLPLDFTATNTELTEDIISYTKHFVWHMDKKLEGYKYGIGGYDEDRVLYKRSKHFDGTTPRTIHLGIDIWGAAGTKVYAPIGGVVHSVAFNNNLGDYGATIVLQHQIDGVAFHTLYGHLSLKDLAALQEGKFISRGELVGHFGEPAENGDWPPHLHFQIIEDMHEQKGDYPGVCSVNEREKYLHNCPNPDFILNMMGRL